MDGRKWRCPSCDFTLYNNTASVVGLIISVRENGKDCVLCIKRGREPRKGFYALPGGFCDPDESAEQVCIRGCREETGLTALSDRPTPMNIKTLSIKPATFFGVCINLSESVSSVLNVLCAADADEITGYKFFPVSNVESVDAISLAVSSAFYALNNSA